MRIKHQIRIIAGKWRGRKIKVCNSRIRPTPDRVRETLFNWLMSVIPEARCLDVFAGTGALGLEALSRGAKFVTFIENDPDALRGLKQILLDLNAQHLASVIAEDALHWLNQNIPSEPFDMVWLDPPFNQGLVKPACDLLAQNKWVKQNSLIYIETEKKLTFSLPSGWNLIKSGRTAQVHYQLFHVA